MLIRSFSRLAQRVSGLATPVRWPTFGLVGIGAAAVILVSDELLKTFVRATLPVCNGHYLASCAHLDLAGPLRLVRTENAGSALGYAQGLGLWIALAAVGVLLIPIYVRRLHRFGIVAALAAGLQTGGALGNLIDRIMLGGATDMLTLGVATVWNFADMALVIGTIMATVLLGTGLRKTDRTQAVEQMKRATRTREIG